MNSDRLALTARAYKAAQALRLGVCVAFDKACKYWFGLSVVVVVVVGCWQLVDDQWWGCEWGDGDSKAEV